MFRFLNSALMNQASDDGGQGGAAGTGGNWFDTFEPDLKGYVETKGFKDPKDLTLAYRNLEKMHGVPADQLLRMPKADDAEGMAKLYERLGRPSKPEDYKLVAPEGGDGEFAKGASAMFHKIGLNPQQAQELTKWYGEFGGARTAQQQAELSESQKAAAAELDKKWGAASEKNWRVVEGVADAFGVDDDSLAKLRDAMGPAAAAMFLYNIGTKLGEDSFVASDGRTANGALAPGAAKVKIQQLQQDKDFVTKLLKGDVEAKNEWDRLHRYAVPTS